jgi:hypothetical protein
LYLRESGDCHKDTQEAAEIQPQRADFTEGKPVASYPVHPVRLFMVAAGRAAFSAVHFIPLHFHLSPTPGESKKPLPKPVKSLDQFPACGGNYRGLREFVNNGFSRTKSQNVAVTPARTAPDVSFGLPFQRRRVNASFFALFPFFKVFGDGKSRAPHSKLGTV